MPMIRYRLDYLGWYQFEWLCQSLLKHHFGAGIQSWGGSGDRGRDAYFEGELEIPLKGKPTAGPFVFQAKFVAEANAAGARPDEALKSAIRAECTAIRNRGTSWGDVRHYVLMTNAPLRPDLRDTISAALRKAFTNAEVTLWGANDLSDLIDGAPNVRTAFPQLLGLGDLTSLLERAVAKPILERSSLSLERAAELAKVFYPTGAYSAGPEVPVPPSLRRADRPPRNGQDDHRPRAGAGEVHSGVGVLRMHRAGGLAPRAG